MGVWQNEQKTFRVGLYACLKFLTLYLCVRGGQIVHCRAGYRTRWRLDVVGGNVMDVYDWG